MRTVDGSRCGRRRLRRWLPRGRFARRGARWRFVAGLRQERRRLSRAQHRQIDRAAHRPIDRTHLQPSGARPVVRARQEVKILTSGVEGGRDRICQSVSHLMRSSSQPANKRRSRADGWADSLSKRSTSNPATRWRRTERDGIGIVVGINLRRLARSPLRSSRGFGDYPEAESACHPATRQARRRMPLTAVELPVAQ